MPFNITKTLINIRLRRELLNYSIGYVAEELYISQFAYYKLESDDSKLTFQRLAEISEILLIAPSALVEW